jgi:serine/threonine protein kinase/tetratricopeptide (TPR) repeat protein
VYCATCGADVRAVEARAGDPYLGLQIADKYKVEQLIGEGAMGRVYVAKQLTLDKPFAVKILAPHLMNDEASHARFAAEAHNCASLNHPNVVSVVDYGRTPDGVTYIVMEYIKGITLERIIAEQYPVARERIVDLTLQILAALAEAHGLGILHRDLKPENILVQQLRTHGELAKVLDFGIAKLMDNPAPGPGLTSAGMVCGTPEYMSPEQARGQKLDARSDLYAVGVILYQMLAGRPPFESESAVEILHKHLHEVPIPPSRLRGVQPDPLEAVCLRALSKEPGNRYASAMEFREELIAASSAPRVAGSIRCNTCGASLKLEHRFCPSCGAPAPTAETTSSIQRRTSQSQLMALDPVTGGPTPLVARERQIQAAQALLGRPQAGLKLRLIMGARGLGKTRLVDEIADLAEQAGWRAYYVGSDPSGARTPLYPIQTMVAQVLEIDPTTCSTQDLFRAANLTGLGFEELPGLAELLRLQQGPAHELEHSVRRRECFAAAVQALLSGGRGQPLLLVFEDIDGYDNASREVLRRLSRRRTEFPVLCLVTSKEPSLDWLGGVTEVLEPLDEAAIVEVWREVAAQATSQPTPPPEVLAAAPMSPLRLEQCIRLAMRGVVAPTAANEADLLRMRVEKQPASVRRLLELAAVLGERFPHADLLDLARQDGKPWDPADLQGALDHAHAEGLLVSLSAKERGFGHRVLYDVAYAMLEPRRREQLHGIAADASRVARISTVTRAVHLVRARDPRAPEVLLQAARYAEDSFDDPTAADFLNAALRLSGMLTSGTGRALQAEVARHATRVMRSPEASTRAVELLRAEIERAKEPAEEAAMRCSLGVQLGRLRQYDEALEALHKALGPAMQADDRATMMQICKELAKVHAAKGDRKQAIRELREGLDMFTLGEGPRTTADLRLWRYLLRVCEMYRAEDELAESRTWCEHALYQAERTADQLGLMRCHGQMAWVLRDLDQLALAEQHLARALTHARHFGDRLTTTELLMERARARAARGRLAEALRYAEEALRLAQGIQWQTGIEHAQRAIAMLTQKDPPPRGAGPTEHSGAFEEPGTKLRDQSGAFGRSYAGRMPSPRATGERPGTGGEPAERERSAAAQGVSVASRPQGVRS